jgi:hypothetical protein
MCRTHLLQVLDPLKVVETHANMQAAPRARAPKKPSGGPKPATRRSERLLEIPAGPSFVDNEYKNGSVIICTVRVQSATSCGPPLPLGRNCARAHVLHRAMKRFSIRRASSRSLQPIRSA